MLLWTPTEVANLALDELPFAQITAWSENTLQAKAARRHYPVVLAEEAERAEWGFARKRELLAEVTNTRETEWGYAYALPNDVALPVRIMSLTDTANPAIPMAGQRLVAGLGATDDVGLPYDLAGGVLFTNASDATLEYIGSSEALTYASALFGRALVLTLAARLAMPLKQDRSIRDNLAAEAEVKRSEAVTLNNNARPQTYGEFIPESVAARQGYDPSLIALLGRGY
jgi:hypothetical protein